MEFDYTAAYAILDTALKMALHKRRGLDLFTEEQNEKLIYKPLVTETRVRLDKLCQ